MYLEPGTNSILQSRGARTRSQAEAGQQQQASEGELQADHCLGGLRLRKWNKDRATLAEFVKCKTRSHVMLKKTEEELRWAVVAAPQVEGALKEACRRRTVVHIYNMYWQCKTTLAPAQSDSFIFIFRVVHYHVYASPPASNDKHDKRRSS
jgi:hypothetical protein